MGDGKSDPPAPRDRRDSELPRSTTGPTGGAGAPPSALRSPRSGTVVIPITIAPPRAPGESGEPASVSPIDSTVPVPIVEEPRAAHAGAAPTLASPLPVLECAACGVLTPVARFCTGCGASLERRFCATCGGAARSGARFCESCGGRLG